MYTRVGACVPVLAFEAGTLCVASAEVAGDRTDNERIKRSATDHREEQEWVRRSVADAYFTTHPARCELPVTCVSLDGTLAYLRVDMPLGVLQEREKPQFSARYFPALEEVMLPGTSAPFHVKLGEHEPVRSEEESTITFCTRDAMPATGFRCCGIACHGSMSELTKSDVLELCVAQVLNSTPLRDVAGANSLLASMLTSKRAREVIEDGARKRVRTLVKDVWEVRSRELGMWVAIREGECGEWRPQLAGVLHDVPFDTCFIGSRGSCYEQWEAGAHGMLLSCGTEMACYATTLPFFTHVRTLRMEETLQGSISLSACKMLTHVCLTSDMHSVQDSERYGMLLRVMAADCGRDSLRAWTVETAALLAELPVLRSVRLRVVWDPSVIATACASLTSFHCDSCATLAAPMPRLEVFTCAVHFAFLADFQVGAAAVAAALRGCHALKLVYISHAWVNLSLLESVMKLRHLKRALLPAVACSEAMVAVCAHNGVVTLFGASVVHFFYSPQEHASGQLLLMPVLSLLLRVRCLARAKRLAFVGAETVLSWVVLKAPTRPFELIMKMFRDMCVVDYKRAAWDE